MKLKTCLLALLAGVTSASIVAGEIENSSIARHDGSKITYYLERPELNSEDRALLVILHGSDCNSVTQVASIHNHLRKVWSNADLLTIEKYGISKNLPYSRDGERPDCPQEYLLNDSPEQRANDVATVLGALKKRYQYKNVILLGGSEGALVTTLVAAQVKHISASISFNGGGRWFIDDVLHNMRSTPPPSENLEEVIAGFRGFAAHVVSSEPFDLNMSNHGYAWWNNVLKIDQESVLLKVESPVLLIQSGLDTSVSPKSAADMATSLKEQGKRNVTYRVYENLDHGLNGVDGESQMPTVVVDMTAWLKTVLN